MRSWEVIHNICVGLWDPDDIDCKCADEYGFTDNIIELFTDCYDYEGFCKWLAVNNCCPANNFRNAEVYAREDYETEEDWEEACENALFYNDEYVCMQW